MLNCCLIEFSQQACEIVLPLFYKWELRLTELLLAQDHLRSQEKIQGRLDFRGHPFSVAVPGLRGTQNECNIEGGEAEAEEGEALGQQEQRQGDEKSLGLATG